MMMRTIALATLALLSSGASAFQQQQQSTRVNTNLFGYVPDGFTKESYAKFKVRVTTNRRETPAFQKASESMLTFALSPTTSLQADEKKKLATKNLGGLGPRGFKSRSMQSFQEAMERGEAEHLLPVFNAEERVRKGEIKREDIP
jgi:hypothetical protein